MALAAARFARLTDEIRTRRRSSLPMTDIPKISRPANDALDVAGLTTLEQVARTPRTEVAALHGMGPKGIRILTEEIERAKLGRWKP
jgi:hypothetical protein